MSECPRGRRGFTLIEVLVSVLIIGILASSAALLVVHPRTLESKTSLHTLAERMRYASDEAALTGSDYGVECALNACRVVSRAPDGMWVNANVGNLAGVVSFEGQLSITLSGTTLNLPRELPGKVSQSPALRLDEAGEWYGFEIVQRTSGKVGAMRIRLFPLSTGRLAVTALDS